MNLQQLLRRSHLSQSLIARRMGVDKAALCRTINGKRNLKAEEAQRLAELLDLSVATVVAAAVTTRAGVAR